MAGVGAVTADDLARALLDPATGLVEEGGWVTDRPVDYGDGLLVTVDGDVNVTRLAQWINERGADGA